MADQWTSPVSALAYCISAMSCFGTSFVCGVGVRFNRGWYMSLFGDLNITFKLVGDYIPTGSVMFDLDIYQRTFTNPCFEGHAFMTGCVQICIFVPVFHLPGFARGRNQLQRGVVPVPPAGRQKPFASFLHLCFL